MKFKQKIFSLMITVIITLLFSINTYAENNRNVSESPALQDILNKSAPNTLTIDSSNNKNMIVINFEPMNNFTTTYSERLKLDIFDNGNVKIHGKIMLTAKENVTDSTIAIARMSQPGFNVGNKPQYQISNFEIVRNGAVMGVINHSINFDKGYYCNTNDLSTSRPIKLVLKKSNDGYYYLYMHKEDYNEIIVGEEVSIEAKKYWEFFDKSITYKQINKKVLSLDESKFNFLFVPDIHSSIIDSRVPKGIELLKDIQKVKDMTIITNGDIANQDGDMFSDSNNMIHKNTLKSIVNMLGKNFLWCKGNHDDNSLQSRLVSDIVFESELRELILNKMNPKGYEITFSDDGLYYFADNKESKIRLVFLNTHENDYTIVNGEIREDTARKGYINQKQLEFVANVALDFSSKGEDKINWHTCFFSHYPFNFEGTKGSAAESCENGDEMWEIIKAFKYGTSVSISSTIRSNPVHNLSGLTKDFGEQGAMNVVGCFYGHFHNDQMQMKDGITLVCSEAFTSVNYNSEWEQISRHVFSYDEFAFDIVSIDKNARTVLLKRIGNDSAGDRMFNY
ncbi:hypothetical protein SH2C18_47290 [Clostridium sediminicola]|uniref:metallophosphoesterase n=1 Tax=Clostridium sediminicola TaxID=3114879 RepID=UPI0031F2199E